MKYFLQVISLLFAQVLVAQNKQYYLPEASEIRYDKTTGMPQYVAFREGERFPERVAERWLRFKLGLSESSTFRKMKEIRLADGEKHSKWVQYYHEIPIQGSMFILHEEKGEIAAWNGQVYKDFVKNVVALDGEAALSYALSYIHADKYMWEDFEQELVLKNSFQNPMMTYKPSPELVYVHPRFDRTKPAVLAYKIDVYSAAPLSHKCVYINATTGAIEREDELIHTADAVGSAATKYSGTRSITTDSYSGGYRLREQARGNGVETYNLGTSTTYSNTDFVDADNNWTGTNAAQDEAARDAHWGAEKTYDYYLNYFGRNSIDDDGHILLSYVHYSSNYVNAFWDGYRMTYGDGNASYTPLTSLDIAGHEITHGFTQHTAGLEYSNESGALNESVSDCFGAAIEFYGKAPTAGNWTMAEDIGAPFRSMSNPNLYGDPDTYNGTNWYVGGADNGGVHTNSGVMNKWFYIVSQGESGTNDVGDVYNVSGIGINVAAQIVYRAMNLYLFPTANYEDMRFYTIKAAMDLYGPNCDAPQVVAVTNAWYAVNVGDPWSAIVTASFVADQTAGCAAPQQVQFTNTSFNAGSYTWDFGDGSPVSTDASPLHTYTALGTYTVTLTASGGTCGTDSEVKTSYISIDPSNPCIAIMAASGTAGTQSSCTGTLYDAGGASSNYYDNVTSIITIAPPGAASVTANFSLLDLENLYDYIYVYNGESDAAPCIGFYTGTTLPPTATATSGKMTIKLVSDPYVNGQGFVISWSCTSITTPPLADFYASYLESCNGEIDFFDISTNAPTSWSWNFGDGNISTLQNPSHTYLNSGIYTVSLTSTNSFGSNTMTKTAYITINKTTAPVTIDDTRCGAGSLTLESSGSGVLSWFANNTSTVVLDTGTTYITPSISTTTPYYVEEITQAPILHVGPVNNSFGGGGYLTVTNQALQFDVMTPLKLISVFVYSNLAFNRTIQLKNSAGAILKDTIIFVNNGPSRLTLNWDLPVQNGLQLSTVATADMDRRNSGASFPYTLPGIVSITGTTAGSGYYYFFYDWEVQEHACLSERGVANAIINAIPSQPTISAPTSLSACIGNSITLSTLIISGYTYQWYKNGSAIVGANTSTLNATSSGNYAVEIFDANLCSNVSNPVTLNFYTAPTPVITGASSICPSTTQTYSVTPYTGAEYHWSLTNGTIQSGCGLNDTECIILWGTSGGNVNCEVVIP